MAHVSVLADTWLSICIQNISLLLIRQEFELLTSAKVQIGIFFICLKVQIIENINTLR